MSLVAAVTEITVMMEKELKKIPEGHTFGPSYGTVDTWLLLLKIALKSAEQEPDDFDLIVGKNPYKKEPFSESLSTKLILASEENLKKDAKLAKAEEREEGLGISMAEVCRGNSDGAMISISPSMPIGAKTIINGEVYALGWDRKLYFQEEDTREYQRSK